MNNVQTAITAIRGMDSDELNQVAEAIKLQRTFNARATARSLTVGDAVEFTARGRTITGKVTKINSKTVIVNEIGFGNWKVTASLLKVVEAA